MSELARKVKKYSYWGGGFYRTPDGGCINSEEMKDSLLTEIFRLSSENKVLSERNEIFMEEYNKLRSNIQDEIAKAIITEFDAAPDDAEFKEGHPIFNLALRHDEICSRLSVLSAIPECVEELLSSIEIAKTKQGYTSVMIALDEVWKDESRLDLAMEKWRELPSNQESGK